MKISFIALCLLLLIRKSNSQSPVEPSAEFGRYCGALKESQTPGKKAYYNCRGAVWAINDTALVITGFTFQPSFFNRENITFWAGPAEELNGGVDNLFPSENGYYVTLHKMKNPELKRLDIKYQTAKKPTAAQVASISRSREEKESQKDKPSQAEPSSLAEPSAHAEPASEPAASKSKDERVVAESLAEPEAEPYFGRRRRRRQTSSLIPANLNLLSGPPSPFAATNLRGQNSFSNSPPAAPRFQQPSVPQVLSRPRRPPSSRQQIPEFLKPSLAVLTQPQQQQNVFNPGQPAFPGSFPQQPQSPTGYFNTFLQGNQQQQQPGIANDFLTAASHWWLPNLLKSAVNSATPKQPISLSLFDLRELFRPASSTVPPTTPPTSPTTVTSKSGVAVTTETSGTVRIPSTKKLEPVTEESPAVPQVDGKPGVKLIVAGGFVEVPAQSWPGDQVVGSSKIQSNSVDFTNPTTQRTIVQPLATNKTQLRKVSPSPVETRLTTTAVSTEPTVTEKSVSQLNSDSKPSGVQMEALTWHAGFDPILLKVPEGKSVSDMRWLSVWDHSRKTSIASVLIPRGPRFEIPGPARIRGFKPALPWKDVRSGPIEILDSKTIRIQDFYFEGDAPGAWFMAGKGVLPTPAGKIIPILKYDGTYDCDFLKPFYNQTVTLKLPGEMEVKEIFWLSVFCVPYAISFAHVYLPYADLNVAPAIEQPSVPYCVLES